MKHAGKAQQAALRLILFTIGAVVVLLGAGFLAKVFGSFVGGLASALVALWVLFTVFTLYFFRDPEPQTPADRAAIVSPAHGTVDVVDETSEAEFMGGRCKRISIFLNVFNVHVQRAPVSGKIVFQKHTDGQFVSATRSDCGEFNENVLLGFVPTDFPNQKMGIRLIAGLIARRIIVWAAAGETVPRGERISLIQFGSRADVYLPLDTKIHCKLGDKVTGGETVIAAFE
ncbi:MAG: phosphatidylserine decarboxylase [Verrucomicrobia bacterium]|jgi:phosphatidylserine decarboxylase|nr:phosphatidylserine decarboxylase [Verrucomicrobiota bacterium]